MSIQVENVSKRFGDFVALDNVSLTIEPGELVALLGPSGSGKTTLLRVVAGLEPPDSGRIYLDSEDATHKHVQERAVGFVFQHYALFRHLSVFENVAFGLRVKRRRERPSEAEIAEKVHRLLGLVQLDWLSDRYPHQLSGGQRQRIALARALAIEPSVLLLDEPFGALDAKVRKDLRRWLRRLHDEIHLTSVFVTHDQEEALEVADRIVVFNHGRIEQIGAPDEVYDHPQTPFVYGFLGHANRFPAMIEGTRATVGQSLIATPEFSSAEKSGGIAYVRPHDLEIVASAAEAAVSATLTHAIKIGPSVRLELLRGDTSETIEVELTRERYTEIGPKIGQMLHLALRRAKVFAVTGASEL
ncbi:MAG: sulfate ABC transporter ATP-binding protein [Burkholderiaceae bacterium]|jgi:sulfate transport system ATP-binding protein